MRIATTAGLFVLLAGCETASFAKGTATTGTQGRGTTGGGETFDGGVGSDGGATVGSACVSSAVVTACASASLICDQATQECRLPGADEQCNPVVGCASSPAGLACEQASFSGQTETVCLVACSSSDSSGCPYGTSCGDPNLPGFCSQQGTPACSAWGTCSLGGNVTGDCVPNGAHKECFASGSLTAAYAPCNPQAINSDAAALCAPGSVCLAAPTLSGTTEGGSCYRLCGGDAGCEASSHCAHGNADAYGTCRPGISCRLDLDVCPANTACVPDDATALAGGCLALPIGDGALGDPCTPETGPSTMASCSSGACLQTNDGGFACGALCDLADGGKPYCVNQVCTPITGAGPTAVLGRCQG